MMMKMMGVVESKNALRAVLLVVCAGLVGIAQGAPPPGLEPSISISVTPGELNLGSIPYPGTHDSPAILTVHIVANYPYGAVTASATPLQHPAGNSVPPERIFIKGPATPGFVSMAGPVAVSLQPEPELDINLAFRVETLLADLAGTYTGTVTFTIGPPY